MHGKELLNIVSCGDELAKYQILIFANIVVKTKAGDSLNKDSESKTNANGPKLSRVRKEVVLLSWTKRRLKSSRESRSRRILSKELSVLFVAFKRGTTIDMARHWSLQASTKTNASDLLKNFFLEKHRRKCLIDWKNRKGALQLSTTVRPQL